MVPTLIAIDQMGQDMVGRVSVRINLPGLLLQTTSRLTVLNFFEKRGISGDVTMDMVCIFVGYNKKELNPEKYSMKGASICSGGWLTFKSSAILSDLLRPMHASQSE